MRSLEWIPELFPRSGGLAAAGFSNLLGRPQMDPLTVLVRETAQNSWDARSHDNVTVEYTIEGWDLNDHEIKALRTDVFVDSHETTGIELSRVLRGKKVRALYIYDRNTRGLGGPLSADEHVGDGVYNWVDFVLNAGKSKEGGGTGGTYGFGKTIAYVASRVSSIVIHSHTIYQGRPQARLIACAVGSQFDRRGRLYTGRHWWGRSVEGGPQPLIGTVADALAEAIGMPEFGRGETGTNLLILDPDLNGRSPEQAMTFIAEAVVWNLWPKLVPRFGVSPMEIRVSWNGEETLLPRPADRPPLDGFVRAFEAILGGDEEVTPGGRRESIQVQRPKTVAGYLATVPMVYRIRATIDDGSDPGDPDAPLPAMPIHDRSHHIALLRSPELVIDYLQGPVLADSGLEWAGVFRCRDEHDRLFAQAEPPTHDHWNPELMPKGSERTIVNVAIREIHKSLEDRWSPRQPNSTGPVSGTSYIADMLGKFVGSLDGSGPGRASSFGSSGRSATQNAKLEIVASGPIELADSIGSIVKARIVPAAGSVGTLVRLRASAALDGTMGSDDLDPELRLVEAQVGDAIIPMDGTSGILELDGREPIELTVLVRRGPGTTVLFDLDVEAMGTI